ncbi:MAG: hypothetical protein ACYC66_16860, partial [Chloroflexota bacterium]
MVATTTIFVNRRSQLPLFDELLVALDQGDQRQMMATVLEAACYSRGIKRKVTTQETSITTAAGLPGEAVLPSVEEILDLI